MNLEILLYGAEWMLSNGRRDDQADPLVVQAIAASAQGVARVAAEAWLAAYELEILTEQIRIRAVERVGRTQAMAPILMRQLDSAHVVLVVPFSLREKVAATPPDEGRYGSSPHPALRATFSPKGRRNELPFTNTT